MNIKKSSLTIFFPCYNDAHSIGQLVKEAFEIAPALTSDFEIIVINDGSTDSSGAVLHRLQKNYPDLKIITHPQNLGYGAALRSGFAAATKDLVFYTDGDGQYNVSELPILLQLMGPDVDFVNGIKMSRSDATYRIVIGNLYSFITRWFFQLPITDVDCDFRLIRRSLLQKLKLTANSGHICPELVKTAQRAGASFREVSVHHYERAHGRSQFFHLKHLSTTFSGLTGLWARLILFHRFRFPRFSPKLYHFLFALIILIALTLRLLPILGNNFYFTMDQANDALHVREILVGRHLPLLGPETSIFGLYAGPLWYYFIAIGFLLFQGHPFGGVFMLILLNVLLTAIIIRRVSREISPLAGLAIGAILQTSWAFYDLSRYAFNPFPNFFLIVVGIFWLTDFLRGNGGKYILAAIPFGLFFHTDLAPAIPANIFYVGLGLISLWRRRLPLRRFLAAVLVLLFFLTPHILSEFTTNFSQTHTLVKELQNPEGIFNNFQLRHISNRFSIIISRSLYRQQPEIGVLGFVLVLILFFRKIHTHKVNPFVKHFIILSLSLFFLSWIFFTTNLGWRDWHTAFLSPLIFLGFLLALTEIPTLLGAILITVSIYSHLAIFISRYQQNFRPTSDASLLVNETAAIDWVYQKSASAGFSSYAYLPSVFDYPYQYLFWWHGLSKYGYLPCEYSSFPGDPLTYLPDSRSYRVPTRTCPGNLRFLIIEPDKNTTNFNQWFAAISQNTALLEESKIGLITVQKRLILQK